MTTKLILFLTFAAFAAVPCYAQFNVAHKDKQAQKSAATNRAQLSAVAPAPKVSAFVRTKAISAATELATVKSVQPFLQGQGGKVLIVGANFDGKTAVTFGGVSAKSIQVSANGDSLTAVIGNGATGPIIITNTKGPYTVPDITFTFIPGVPSISTVSPTKFSPGTKITIIGTNFVEPLSVSFQGSISSDVTVISLTALSAEVPSDVTEDSVTVTTAAGSVTYPFSAKPLDGNADLTVPDLGKGITIIPTPTFTYSGVHANKWFTFTASIWANSLGTDSTRQAVGNKFLLAQISLFGFKVAGNIRFTNTNSDVDLALYGEQNLLVKKIGFFDTVAKSNTSFNPLVLHTRIGLTGSLYNFFFLGIYGNLLSVETENQNISAFFNTGGQTVFAYPEVDAAGIFTLSKGSNQQIKAEFDMIINNKSANHFYSSGNSVIPYFKLGFVTGL